MNMYLIVWSCCSIFQCTSNYDIKQLLHSTLFLTWPSEYNTRKAFSRMSDSSIVRKYFHHLKNIIQSWIYYKSNPRPYVRLKNHILVFVLGRLRLKWKIRRPGTNLVLIPSERRIASLYQTNKQLKLHKILLVPVHSQSLKFEHQLNFNRC